MPPSAYPSSKLFTDSLFISLRAIGIQSQLNAHGLLMSAKCIMSSHGITETLDVAKSRDLLMYIDANIDTLIQEVDPEGYSEYQQLSSQSEQQLVGLAVGGSWAAELRSISWIPVFNAPPTSRELSGNYFGLPWSPSLAETEFASPRDCSSSSDIWLASYSRRISKIDASRPLTRAVLGWNQPIRGDYVAVQLLQMSNIYNNQSVEDKRRMIESFNVVLPKIYQTLY